MPVCIDRSRPPKREGETKEERWKKVMIELNWTKCDLLVQDCEHLFRAKRRRSRWTEEGSKTYIPGMPTMIPEGLSPQQEKVLVDSKKWKNAFVIILLKSFSTYSYCHSGILASIEDWGSELETAQWWFRDPPKPRRQVCLKNLTCHLKLNWAQNVSHVTLC